MAKESKYTQVRVKEGDAITLGNITITFAPDADFRVGDGITLGGITITFGKHEGRRVLNVTKRLTDSPE